MNSTKGAHELQHENSRDEQGTWKDRVSDGLPMIHTFAAPLWSASKRIHKLQVSESGHEDPGESELPNEWWCKCQMVCRDKHMSIDKFKS